VTSLLLWGTPLRELLAFLEGYRRELGLNRVEKRQMIGEFLERTPPRLRRSIRGRLRNPGRASRMAAAFHDDGGTIHYLRDFPPGDIRDAFAQGTRTPTVQGRLVERREQDHAIDTWGTACVLHRFKLPARRHVACRVEEGGKGTLLIESPATPFETADAASPERLASFARLLHAFGFRFATCSDTTIARQAGPPGLFTFRQGSGYVLDDAGAVRFLPETTTEASSRVIASWLQGAEERRRFLAAAERPLRFRL
jgi:hypothetical protein